MSADRGLFSAAAKLQQDLVVQGDPSGPAAMLVIVRALETVHAHGVDMGRTQLRASFARPAPAAPAVELIGPG